MIHPTASGDGPDLYAVISLSEREARQGGRKLVNIAHNRTKKTLFVNIPPGLSEGSTLRLSGMGRQTPEGIQGDLYLKVQIKG